MDTRMAYTGSTAAHTAPTTAPALHSTTALLSSLTALAHSSLNDHINDYADAHKWIDSFFEKLEHKPRGPAGAPRPAMSELMKTPGRKRVAGAGSAHHSSTHHLSLASAKKDPVATLLFPSSAAKKTVYHDKENSPAPSPASKNGSPRRGLSPLGSVKGKGPAALSPMRLGSPRSVLSPSRQQSTPVLSSRTAAPSPKAPVIAHDFALPAQDDELEDVFGANVHDLSNVMEEEEDEEEGEATPVVSEKAAEREDEESFRATEEEKADLSIIGEEEEEDESEDTSNVSAVTAPSSQAGLAAQSSIVPETQFSQPAPLAAAAAPAVQTPSFEAASLVLSPQQRTVSGASSVAPEADGDTAVPLNDAPSALRNAHSDALSSSLSSSANARTPGNSSRFAVGSYSAAKLGMGSVGLGSSPPVAPSTTGKPVGDSRTSVGGNGARLNFVGLPKKSLGLGLGLGRNWNANGSASSSQISDSQPSTQGSSSAAPSQSTQASTASSTNAVASSTQNSFFETAPTGTATSTGAVKRKSLTGPDTANKAAKVSPAPPQTAQEQEQEEARKRREALTNRMQSLQARQSNIAGRTSNVAGPFGSNPLMFGKSHGPPSSLFLPLGGNVGPASKPLAASTSSTAVFNASTAVTPTAELASNPLSRRPSVMERVKSFEQTSTTSEHLHPPSPSKIPAAFARSASPKPSALSPRGMPSPPASPRPLTRSATSGLPLATFASPGKAAQLAPPVGGLASPKLGAAIHRSPPPAAAPSPAGPVSISTILSPPPTAPLSAPTSLPWSSAFSPSASAPTSAPPAQAAFVPPAITAKPTIAAPVVRSTTPDGSPPPPKGLASILQRFDEEIQPAPADSFVIGEAEDEDELEEDEEEEDEVPSIRAINASIPPAAVIAAQAKAAAAAAEREREAAAQKAAEQAARDLEEQEAEREREEMMKKRLPSLPEPTVLTPDDEDDEAEDDNDEEEDDEVEVQLVAKPKQNPASVVSTATKENLSVKASPSKIMMPGTFGAAHVSQQAKPVADEEEDGSEGDDEEEEDEPMEDRTNMSMASSVATSTFNYTAHSQAPFKPVKPQLAKQGSKTSLASSVSSTSALGLNRSISNAGIASSGLRKPEPAGAKVKSIQQAKAAAKKEKEERDRKAALREEKRAALEKKKQDEERKVKIEVLEKKRKEREEAAAKAKANAARALKRTDDEAPAKKRKTDQDQQQQQKPVRPEIKKVTQPTRPLNASTSSQHISSLASSQNRTGAMGPPGSALNKSTGPAGALNKSAGPSSGLLNKSAGASSMIGQKFMSNQIRLPNGNNASQAGQARPAPTVPKPFNVSQSSMRPPQPPQQVHHTPKQPDEPYQELPEIDSEYSDSDDEAHEKKVAAFPRWAQSPALAHALMEQRKVNPDEIFGPIPPLSIQEIFRDSSSAARLRARTSSAQWEGTDAISQTEIARYHRVMGFASGSGEGPSQGR
ncbi:hypothetical protein JCM6882_006790 [Rhodosporidiobolus microsporus]